MRRRAVTVAAAALVSLLARDATAICVEGFPPCDRFWKADAVFIGTVTGFTCQVIDPDPEGPPADEVHFKVVEAFRGVTGTTVTLRDWVCGDILWSEAVGFREGETYFVYAHRPEGSEHLSTSKCSTRTVAESQDSVAYVRTLQQPLQTGRVYGSVIHGEDDWNGGLLRRELPEGLTVTLSGATGSRRLAPRSDGSFSFEAVPPGEYELAVLAEGPYSLDGPVTARIAAPHACSKHSLYVHWQGTLRGRALAADGRPAGNLWLTLIPASLDLSNSAGPSAPLPTAPDGEFAAERVAPGEYLLGVNIADPPSRERPYPATWFPGVTDRDSAQIIRMTPGADIDLGDLLVPPPLTEVRLNGRVLLADGTPADRAWVNLIDPAFPAYFVGETVWSREDGSFSIPAFRGQRYVVKARLERGTRWPEVRSSPVVAGTSGLIVIRMEQ